MMRSDRNNGPHSDDFRTYCLDCGYDLHGLLEARCPECGRAFDPRDPHSSASSPHPHRYLRFRWLFVGVFYPLLVFVLIYATWCVAGAHLGHPPRPNIDDPKSIPGLVASLYAASRAALLGFVVYVPLFPIVLIGYVLFGRPGPRMERSLVLLIIYIGMLSLTWAVVRDSPTVLNWYFD